MKYKELPIEEARTECKKHILKKVGKTFLTKCEECPLRRERLDEKGKTHTLFCYWKLQYLISELVEEWEEMGNEEIRYYEDNK